MTITIENPLLTDIPEIDRSLPEDLQYDPARDMRYIVYYDESGRIHTCGTLGYSVYLRDLNDGKLVAEGGAGASRATIEKFWVDTSGPFPLVTERKSLDRGFDTNVLEPRQEAVLAGVHPCTVTFVGPCSGTQEHEEFGDLLIGFVVPGVYTITLEPFPDKPARYVLYVEPSGTADKLPNINLELESQT